MAGSDIRYMPFGYAVGGTGHDETEVFTESKKIKLISFSGNADNATCTITSRDHTGTYRDVHKFKSSDTNELNSATGTYIWFGEAGSTFHGMKIDCSHADDYVYIHVV